MKRITDNKEAESIMKETGKTPVIKCMLFAEGLFFNGYDKNEKPLFSSSDITAKEYAKFPRAKFCKLKCQFKNLDVKYIYYF
jgi:hypothetical protein